MSLMHMKKRLRMDSGSLYPSSVELSPPASDCGCGDRAEDDEQIIGKVSLATTYVSPVIRAIA